MPDYHPGETNTMNHNERGPGDLAPEQVRAADEAHGR